MDSHVNVKRALRAIEAAAASCKTREGRNRIEEVQLHTAGVVEPGYDSDAIVATGNWNDCTRYNRETRQSETIEDVPSRLGSVLEKMGVTIEWLDEWDACGECSRLVRTRADSYSWKPSYVSTDSGLVCFECIDPAEHLESLEGNPRTANTIETIDPAQHGYTLIQGDFEHGFHPGQDADPKVIADSLRKLGVCRFLFQIDRNGQFDTRFSVYVHNDELPELDPAAWKAAPKDGPSVAEAMERGLKAATVAASQLADGEGVKVATVHADGTATAKLVSPEDFIAGKALS
jgi:hypothetical protein